MTETAACPPELMGIYKVNLYNPLGALVAVFDDWRRLEIKKIVNSPGYAKITLNGHDPRTNLFERNSLIEVLRKIPGLTMSAVPASKQRANGWYVEWEGLHVDSFRNTFSTGDETYISKAVGYLDFAQRRQILWKTSAGASESKKIAIPSQTAIYEFVNENCGPAALAASDRLIDGVITGLTVPAWTGGGLTWYGGRSYRNVLEVIQDIGDFSTIDFDIVGVGGANWRFETYIDQLGEDRTTTDLDTSTGLNGEGNPPVIFSIALSNVQRVSYKNVVSGSANVVSAIGQGRYAARMTSTQTTAADIDPGRINQREMSRNANTQDDQLELDTLASEWLVKMQPVEDFTFLPMRVPSTLYGVDYWFGDKITARYKDMELDKRLLGVTIIVDTSGETFQGWDFETLPK